LEITENRVRYDVVEELMLEISEIQVCFDAVLWKSIEIQIRNQLKGVAFSVKTLMLTHHHSEGAACLVKFKVTINKIYSISLTKGCLEAHHPNPFVWLVRESVRDLVHSLNRSLIPQIESNDSPELDFQQLGSDL